VARAKPARAFQTRLVLLVAVLVICTMAAAVFASDLQVIARRTQPEAMYLVVDLRDVPLTEKEPELARTIAQEYGLTLERSEWYRQLYRAPAGSSDRLLMALRQDPRIWRAKTFDLDEGFYGAFGGQQGSDDGAATSPTDGGAGMLTLIDGGRPLSSYEEARRLLPFPIREPTYVPAGMRLTRVAPLSRIPS
jgi:hypothetical protein